MVAGYVVPELNGFLRPQRDSADYVEANKAELMAGASQAVMSKIMAHNGAAAAMATTMQQFAERRERHDNDPRFRPGAGRLPAGPADRPLQSSFRATALGLTFIFGS